LVDQVVEIDDVEPGLYNRNRMINSALVGARLIYNNNCVPSNDDISINVGISFQVLCNG
jgi:hypothetical protein